MAKKTTAMERQAEVDRIRKECDEKLAGYGATVDDACQALFCWRLACVLLASLSASLIALMLWAR